MEQVMGNSSSIYAYATWYPNAKDSTIKAELQQYIKDTSLRYYAKGTNECPSNFTSFAVTGKPDELTAFKDAARLILINNKANGYTEVKE